MYEVIYSHRQRWTSQSRISISNWWSSNTSSKSSILGPVSAIMFVQEQLATSSVATSRGVVYWKIRQDRHPAEPSISGPSGDRESTRGRLAGGNAQELKHGRFSTLTGLRSVWLSRRGFRLGPVREQISPVDDRQLIYHSTSGPGTIPPSSPCGSSAIDRYV